MTVDKLRIELARVRKSVLPKAQEPRASIIRKRLLKADRALEYNDLQDIKLNFMLLTIIV